MIPGIVAGAVPGESSSVPPPIVVTEDPFWLSTVLQATFEGSDGSTSFTDNSLFAYAISSFGGPSIQGNRLSLDGNDGLTVDLTGAVGPGAWTPGRMYTWDMWAVKFAAKSADMVLLAQYTGVSGSQSWRLMWVQSTATLNFQYYDGSSVVDAATASFDPTLGTEYDISVSWDGSDIRFYIDGVYIGGGAFSAGFFSVHIGLRIGYDRGNTGNDRNFFNGTIHAIRLTRAARMTSTTNYQRHALPLATAQAATTDALRAKRHLILYGEGADGTTKFIDHSPFQTRLSVNGAVENDTGVSVNGTPSILFGNSNSNFLNYDENIKGHMATVGLDLCFEAYVRFTVTSQLRTIIQKRGASAVDFWWQVSAANKLTMGWYTNGTQRLLLSGATSLAVDTTYHVAMIRKTGVTYLFIDGVLDGSGTQSANESQGNMPFQIGRDWTNSGRYFRGSLNWLRMTIGDPVYNTAGFTPDSVPPPIN